MFGDLPYYLPERLDLMQGCFGPPGAMGSAIGAYTPNVPWARIGCSKIVDRHGNGTSSATPQVAAAAALVMQSLGPQLARPARIEAVKAKLFGAASKNATDFQRFYGNGILRAADAVAHVVPPPAPGIVPTNIPAAKVGLDLVELTKSFNRMKPHKRIMLSAEAMQLAATDRNLSKWIDRPTTDFNVAERKKGLRALRDHPNASNELRKFLRKATP